MGHRHACGAQGDSAVESGFNELRSPQGSLVQPKGIAEVESLVRGDCGSVKREGAIVPATQAHSSASMTSTPAGGVNVKASAGIAGRRRMSWNAIKVVWAN